MGELIFKSIPNTNNLNTSQKVFKTFIRTLFGIIIVFPFPKVFEIPTSQKAFQIFLE